jgi:hypothetical protein
MLVIRFGVNKEEPPISLLPFRAIIREPHSCLKLGRPGHDWVGYDQTGEVCR